MRDLLVFIVPDGVSTPSGSEFKPGEDEGGNESDSRRPDLVPEAISSKRRTKGLPKPTREAITQARRDFNYPATPAASGGKRAREALSDERSLPR